MADTIELTGTLEDYRSTIDELNESLSSLDATSQQYTVTLENISSMAAQATDSLGLTSQQTQELADSVQNTSSTATDNFNTLAGAISGISPAFATVTKAWKTFQATMMANPWIAVITAGLAAIVSVVKLFSNAIDSNEKTSQKWKTTLSTFRPIIDAIKNAIDWLVSGFVNLLNKLSSGIPKAVSWVGNASKSVLNVIAIILDGINWIPRQIAGVFEKIIPYITDGIQTILKPIKSLLDAVGLDEWSNKITNAINSVSNTMKSFANGTQQAMLAPGNAVRKLANTVSTAMSNLGNQMQHHRDLQEKQNQLDERSRQVNEQLAESYHRTAEARAEYEKARANKDVEKMKEAEAKMEKEANFRAKTAVELEKQKYEVMLAYSKLTANDAKTNQALSDQRVKITQAQTKAQQELNQALRLRARLEQQEAKAKEKNDKAALKAIQKQKKEAESAAKAAEKRRLKELKEAEKAEQQATKEAQQESKRIAKETQNQIKAYEDEYKAFDKLQSDKLKLLESTNVAAKSDYIKYENERYNEQIKLFNKELAAYQDLLDNENVLEADKNRARQRLTALEVQIQAAELEHKIAMNKIDADALKKMIDDLKNSLDLETNRSTNIENTRYNEAQQRLNDAYKKRLITAAEYLKESEKLNKEHQQNLSSIEVNAAEQRAKDALTIIDQFISDIQNRYKDMETIVKNAEDNINNLRSESEYDDPNDDPEVIAAQQKYDLLRSIYESGENAITNIITTLMNERERAMTDGNTEITDQIQQQLNTLLNALHISSEDVKLNTEEMLRTMAELFGFSLPELEQRWEEYNNKIAEANTKQTQQITKNTTETAKNEEKVNEKRRKQFTKLADQMAKTMSAVSDYWQSSIEQRLEAGKISQEQAEEEFERLKQFNIAQAVVDTLAGALSSQMSVWKQPGLDLWAKIAMSALLGIQTLASGWAQINQIKSQTLNGAGSGSSSQQTNVIVGSATPILNEAEDMNRMEVASAGSDNIQDMRVYVVESDITNAQNRTKTRVSEATF